MPANSGQVTASISLVALSFMVQLPSGIIARLRAMSLPPATHVAKHLSVRMWWRIEQGVLQVVDVAPQRRRAAALFHPRWFSSSLALVNAGLCR